MKAKHLRSQRYYHIWWYLCQPTFSFKIWLKIYLFIWEVEVSHRPFFLTRLHRLPIFVCNWMLGESLIKYGTHFPTIHKDTWLLLWLFWTDMSEVIFMCFLLFFFFKNFHCICCCCFLTIFRLPKVLDFFRWYCFVSLLAWYRN